VRAILALTTSGTGLNVTLPSLVTSLVVIFISFDSQAALFH
jgi:hypothetical protein